MKKLSGFKLIGELPKGDWELGVCGGMVVAICPDHEPRIVIDDKLEILHPVNEPVFVEWAR